MSVPDIDRILDAVRAEARARGAKGGIGHYPDVPAAPGLLAQQTQGLPQLECTHVTDYLALPLDVFLELAYRKLLGRAPDADGRDHFQRAILRGRLTRVEVLGRIALSPEARAHRASIPGLHFAFAAATLYRLPIAGPVAALVTRALALPSHLQDRSRIEASALASGQWMKR